MGTFPLLLGTGEAGFVSHFVGVCLLDQVVKVHGGVHEEKFSDIPLEVAHEALMELGTQHGGIVLVVLNGRDRNLSRAGKS